MKITGSDIHLLSVFDSFVRNQGFSAAQVELGLSQPTISNHITALEERLGVKLCQRGRRGFMLTEKGRMVNETGQALLEMLNAHSAHLAELKGNLVGQLKIAVVDSVSSDANFKLPEAIGTFTKVAPAVRIELGIAGPQEMLSGIMDGSWDIGIGSFDNAVSGFQITDLYKENHALYCAETHPFFHMPDDQITPDSIRKHPWSHRGYWKRQRQKSLKLSEMDRIVHEIEAQLILVLSGRYLGLLPEHLAVGYENSGKLRRLPCSEFDYVCDMQMAALSGAKPKVNELFMKTLRECYL